jgi:hypothetical protein
MHFGRRLTHLYPTTSLRDEDVPRNNTSAVQWAVTRLNKNKKAVVNPVNVPPFGLSNTKCHVPNAKMVPAVVSPKPVHVAPVDTALHSPRWM